MLKALRDFLEANNLKADWDGIERRRTRRWSTRSAMMSPFGPREKQALLEAPDLKTRAEILVAITEIELAKGGARRHAAAVAAKRLHCRSSDVS